MSCPPGANMRCAGRAGRPFCKQISGIHPGKSHREPWVPRPSAGVASQGAGARRPLHSRLAPSLACAHPCQSATDPGAPVQARAGAHNPATREPGAHQAIACGGAKRTASGDWPPLLRHTYCCQGVAACLVSRWGSLPAFFLTCCIAKKRHASPGWWSVVWLWLGFGVGVRSVGVLGYPGGMRGVTGCTVACQCNLEGGALKSLNAHTMVRRIPCHVL